MQNGRQPELTQGVHLEAERPRRELHLLGDGIQAFGAGQARRILTERLPAFAHLADGLFQFQPLEGGNVNQLGQHAGCAAERFEQLEEALQICLQMWSDDDGAYAGKHFQLAETVCVPPPLSAMVIFWPAMAVTTQKCRSPASNCTRKPCVFPLSIMPGPAMPLFSILNA